MKILNPKRGDLIRFCAMNDFIGENEILKGKVIGKGREIRKMYPVEMALAPENYSLVERDIHGTKTYYVVTPEEVKVILESEEQ